MGRARCVLEIGAGNACVNFVRFKFRRTLRCASLKFHRTLRCARDPCPADGLAPPGCARPRRQPLVRVAPGRNRNRSCRTSRLSTPRARGPVLAAGAHTRDMHDDCMSAIRVNHCECTRDMKPTRGGEAIAEPTPSAHRVPGPLAGGAVAAPCRPPRKAMGPVPARCGNVAPRDSPSLTLPSSSATPPPASATTDHGDAQRSP